MTETTIQVPMITLITLRAGLHAEMRGMRLTRGQSCGAIIKSRFGWKGSKASLLAQLNEVIAEAGGPADRFADRRLKCKACGEDIPSRPYLLNDDGGCGCFDNHCQ